MPRANFRERLAATEPRGSRRGALQEWEKELTRAALRMTAQRRHRGCQAGLMCFPAQLAAVIRVGTLTARCYSIVSPPRGVAGLSASCACAPSLQLQGYRPSAPTPGA